MYRSPQQRFQRTAILYMSPNNALSKQSPQRCGSPKHHQIRQQLQSQLGIKSKLFEESKIQVKQKVQQKIVNLQKMLQYQKNKRQTQFSQLYKMINSMRQRNRNSENGEDPSFSYNQLQFPMTPRVRTKDNQFTKSPCQQNYQTFTPAYETVTKAKQSRSKNAYREDDNFFQRSLQDFSFKSLQLLLKKIQRESEFNNRNVMRMQQQMISMRSIISNFKTRTGIPIQIEKFVRDSYMTLKNQMETQRNSLKSLITDTIQQKMKQKSGESRSLTVFKKQQELERQLIQNIQKIQNTNQFMGAQMKALDQKIQSQITEVHQIIQQKFACFKQSLMDSLLKNQRQSNSNLMREIQHQKIKIAQIQETNSDFLQELEKTIQNIQDKLKVAKNAGISEKQIKQICSTDIFAKKVRQQSQKNDAKLKKQLQDLLKISTLELMTKIKKVEQQIQGIDILLIKNQKQKLTKHISLNQFSTPSHSSLSQTDNNFFPNKQAVNQIIDKQLEQAAQFYRKDSQDACEEHQRIIQLISQNCSFLQSRNCTIQQSVSDVVCVLNDIVEKLRNLM